MILSKKEIQIVNALQACGWDYITAAILASNGAWVKVLPESMVK